MAVNGKPKDWQDSAEEAILDHFRNPEHEPFHPDFLEHIILDEHRGVIGRAVMALVNKRLIVKCGRRKSTIPSRKGAEANEYRLTELGRDRIAGVGGGFAAAVSLSGGAATGHSPHSGDRSIVGVGTNNREGSALSNGATLDRPASSSQCVGTTPTGARSSLGADPGEDRSVVEAIPLFEESAPPSMYDPRSEAA